MTDIAFFANGSRSEPFSSPLNVLERAIAKLVVLGDEAGVSSEQMILLLDAGMTVPELRARHEELFGEVAKSHH